MKRLILVALAAPLLLWAAPAGAQSDLPDLPGMGVVSNNLDTGASAPTAGRTSVRGTADLSRPAMPASGRVLPQTDNLAELTPTTTTADPTDAPAVTTAGASGDTLPRTGLPIAGLALLGVALASFGRMLIELVPRS